MPAEKVRSDIEIRDLIARDPDEFVEHLLQADMVYWEAIKQQVIYPFLAPGTTYGNYIRER